MRPIAGKVIWTPKLGTAALALMFTTVGATNAPKNPPDTKPEFGSGAN